MSDSKSLRIQLVFLNDGSTGGLFPGLMNSFLGHQTLVRAYLGETSRMTPCWIVRRISSGLLGRYGGRTLLWCACLRLALQMEAHDP